MVMWEILVLEAAIMVVMQMEVSILLQIYTITPVFPLIQLVIVDARSSWSDQKNQLDYMHNLEKKMF
jgi:hypothetical protein